MTNVHALGFQSAQRGPTVPGYPTVYLHRRSAMLPIAALAATILTRKRIGSTARGLTDLDVRAKLADAIVEFIRFGSLQAR
ncbi:hypothetical protein AMAG_20749 [Allomyces macrogynus ATCC 38327]|uniref:Uncharacterized protein n=1 Tax=Allomyces macrogynus (strain ATCC 38327) TaxID=578462 RepID=A0A0L0TF80_ALLM3|nr:hypothetical protein AMAG_20749 [Allomyces macrogynus ATCC 38327]|eukprot:KNE73360.1 hypothetical protein AMAG_20749 [Allomyces macrogynus ATCC 38327]